MQLEIVGVGETISKLPLTSEGPTTVQDGSWRLDPIAGVDDAVLLTFTGQGCGIVEALCQEGAPGASAAGSAQGGAQWRVIDALDRAQPSTVVHEGHMFYLEGRRDEQAWEVRRSVPTREGRCPTDPPARAEAANGVSDDEIEIIIAQSTKRARMDAPQTTDGPSTSGSAPFGLMWVQGLPHRFNSGCLGVRLRDVVRGDMRACLASNYMVELPWLIEECPELLKCPRFALVHGERDATFAAQAMAQGRELGLSPDRFSLHSPPLPIPYGTHHSKFFLILYERGIRVAIHTANLLHRDCTYKTQGIYVQDFPRKSGSASDGDCAPFESDLVEYLEKLHLPRPWGPEILASVRDHDYSSARVQLVASVPGYHRGGDVDRWGHAKLRRVLAAESFDDDFTDGPVAYQFSSLGSLDEKWVWGEFAASMSAGRSRSGQPLGPLRRGAAGLQLVWPMREEVRDSMEGWAAGCSVPGTLANVDRPFLKPLWHRWDGSPAGRQAACPHIKSMMRYSRSASPANGGAVSLAWFLLGSHNMSKAAWGVYQKKETQLMVRSYELGAVFLPRLEEAYRAHPHAAFTCTPERPAYRAPSAAQGVGGQLRLVASVAEAGVGPGEVWMPVPYPLPPVPYRGDDAPWAVDVPQREPDALGYTFRT